MAFSFPLLILAGLISVISSLDPDTLCKQLLRLDCKAYSPVENDESVCGTNNVLYLNYCEFSQARCIDRTIDIKQVGHCFGNTPKPTTNPPTPTQTVIVTDKTTTLGGPISSQDATTASTAMTTVATMQTTMAAGTPDPSVELLCKNKQYITCPSEIDLRCGSDNVLYKNDCLFALAHCDNRSLVEVDISNCRH